MKVKRVINLDSSFIPTVIPEIEFNSFIFSGGELHIKLNNNISYSEIDSVVITQRVRNSDDLMKILITKDALKRKGIEKVILIMPYLPYARQDRQCDVGESFTLKVFCDIINSANFEEVIIIDSHSDVGPALLNNCINISNSTFLQQTLLTLDEQPVLVSPDAGSNKKCNKLAIEFCLDLVKCDKVRNTKTGELTGFEVFSNDLQGRDCLIVDDICDGGGTFIGLAKELKAKNADKLYLLVTHGIFSKGIVILEEYFDMIYCSDSFKTLEEHLKVTQFKIQL